MAREANINPFYWHLWAQRARGNLARTGYPTQVPFYTAPPLGDLYEPGQSGGGISQEDLWIVEGIEEALCRHRQKRPAEVLALEIWEGAYLDAAAEREDRIREKNISYGACKKAAWRAKMAVERFLYTGV